MFARTEGKLIRLHRLSDDRDDSLVMFRWWDDPDVPWHRQQVEEAWKKGEWFVAEFHLGRLAMERPWEGALHLRRAHALSQLGKPAEAAVNVVRAFLQDRYGLWSPPVTQPRLVMPRVKEDE
jgi:hypothetical protein